MAHPNYFTKKKRNFKFYNNNSAIRMKMSTVAAINIAGQEKYINHNGTHNAKFADV
jgi:hypothetical protein